MAVTFIEIGQSLANQAKRELVAAKCLDSRYRVIRDRASKTVKFPIISSLYRGKYPVVSVTGDAVCEVTIVNPKARLQELSDHMVRRYDLLGNIVILEIPDELAQHQEEIAELVQRVNPGVSTVVKKRDKHDGVFRTQQLQHVTGIPTTIANFNENGCRFEIDVEKVYFSVRQSTERMRIAQQINPGERVLVMFSGAAPFPCVLARHSQAEHIVGIELNPVGHHYGLKNVRLNRLESRVSLYQGDVAEVAPKLTEQHAPLIEWQGVPRCCAMARPGALLRGQHAPLFDRIVMPLPKTSIEFLELAISLCRPGGVIHLYMFGSSEDMETTPREIVDIFAKTGRSYKVTATVRCGHLAPGIWRLCRDITATS